MNVRMNEQVRQLTEEIQSRIRALAYLLWEAAGRQQGMALEYWLEAEREVLHTMQAAADTFMEPSNQEPGANPDDAPAEGQSGKDAPQR